MITALAHACFTVRDMEATLVFYRDKLGLSEAFAWLREDGSKSGVYLHVGARSFLEFFEEGVAESTEGRSYRHLCFEVDDIEETVAALRKGGVEVTDARVGDDRSLQAWLADPDGNRIELHQYTPESRQRPSLAVEIK